MNKFCVSLIGFWMFVVLVIYLNVVELECFFGEIIYVLVYFWIFFFLNCLEFLVVMFIIYNVDL